jgi:threonine dehydratase
LLPLSLCDIEDAASLLHGVAVRTPLLLDPGESERFGAPVYLKPENLQRSGSFKFRGAYAKIASLPPDVRAQGVITYSSGNHAQAVALAGRLLAAPATVVMPEDAVPAKVEGARRLGARVVQCGLTSLERKAEAERIQAQEGQTMVPPFDDWQVIAGQATIALEIAEDMPDVANVLVPVGGGGLIAGIALFFACTRPDVVVCGVEPAGADDARRSLALGQRVTLGRVVTTVADGLRTSTVGERPFQVIRELVREIVAVDDTAILAALRHLFLEAKLVAEPSGATALAALQVPLQLRPGPTVVVVSGGNVDPALLARTVA